jgi:hypothetical protein
MCLARVRGVPLAGEALSLNESGRSELVCTGTHNASAVTLRLPSRRGYRPIRPSLQSP